MSSGPLDAAVRDSGRLAALRATALLDTPADPAFDRLTSLATQLLQAPIGLVSLVDAERQYFKSSRGLPEPWLTRRSQPLAYSFCRHAVASRSPLIVEDARAHPLVHDNPSVGELGIVAYAGVPLLTERGHVLGTLCVADSVPRRWTAADIDLLTTLAAAAMTEIELRAALRAAAAQTAVARAAAAERDAVLESIPEALLIVDDRWRFTSVNRKAALLLGRDRASLDGEELWRAFPALVGSEFEAGCRRVAATGRGESFEAAFPPLPHWFEVHAEPHQGALSVYLRDVSARHSAETRLREREAELRHAQKMEAVGQLAGGVAHDFNNLLTVIRAHAEFLSSSLPAGSVERDDAVQVMRAADRAAELTRQLLAFSRRQTLEPRPVRPAELVADLAGMLRRVLGAGVALEIRTDAPSGWTVVDPGQLEQVVVNLAVNARDAMPEGGTLAIEVRDEHVAAAAEAADPARAPTREAPGPLAQCDAPPGDYVAILVRDSGSGMSPAVRQRMFEPFFTTKAQGRGTGLGLSVVYGIVSQSGGHLCVESEVGRGTAVAVLLPLAETPASEPAPGARAGEPPARMMGTVLLVEDEDAVRAVAHRILERRGYRVLEARDGNEAVTIAASLDAPVDLLLTDLVIPGLDGRELARRLRAEQPGLRVLYVSGYPAGPAGPADVADDVVVPASVAALDAPCLRKPFTSSTLERAVREQMEGKD